MPIKILFLVAFSFADKLPFGTVQFNSKPHVMSKDSIKSFIDIQKTCDKRVLLLCGLPGAGKSTLARQLRDEQHSHRASSFAFIDYDDIQDSLLLMIDEEEQDERKMIQAWRDSRTSALQRLEALLTDSTTGLILLDDNFHLQSMRKQIFQSCQSHVTSASTNAAMPTFSTSHKSAQSIHFGLIWIDTPVDLCLERNTQRARRVPDRVIRDMQLKFEAPGEKNYIWDQSTLRLDGTASPSTHLEQLHHFTSSLKRLTMVPPIVDPAVEEARIAVARNETQASAAHQLDQYLRCCVQAVAREYKSCAGAANQCRKILLLQLKHRHDIVMIDIEHAFIDQLRRKECCHVDWKTFQPSLHKVLLVRQAEFT